LEKAPDIVQGGDVQGDYAGDIQGDILNYAGDIQGDILNYAGDHVVKAFQFPKHVANRAVAIVAMVVM
jgi:hypothetical protein